MEVTIHNVGHGLCISLMHQNGNVMLWDCGHSETNRPSDFLPALGVTAIDRFFVTNYDEDHISNLPDLREIIRIRSLHRNITITSTQLRLLKRESGPISTAMESMLEMIDRYTGGPLSPAPSFPGVTYTTFNNAYSADFSDTNNISLATILECGNTTFLIPGDLEKKGWEGLLKNNSFCNELGKVDVLVASHHGRENGYCKTIFEKCKPRVVVFSDSEVKHATQEMSDTYRNHATGVQFNGEIRYVLSTRNDGSLTWTIN